MPLLMPMSFTLAPEYATSTLICSRLRQARKLPGATT